MLEAVPLVDPAPAEPVGVPEAVAVDMVEPVDAVDAVEPVEAVEAVDIVDMPDVVTAILYVNVPSRGEEQPRVWKDKTRLEEIRSYLM